MGGMNSLAGTPSEAPPGPAMARSRDKNGPARPDRGLRPVQDVIGRIRFDAALDVARFTVGYEERFAGVREAPLAGVLGEGEVPWHRIWFIKAGALVVWDRRQRIDLILGSGVSPAPDLATVQRACAPQSGPSEPPTRRTRAPAPAARFVGQPCFRFDHAHAAWVPHAAAAREAVPESLQVVTYNVLFDLYETEKIYSERRRAVCIELLRARDADIIALQEVTPQLWAQLLATPWVQDGYHVSAGPDAAGLDPYGQALLSRWPLTLELHEFSAQKRLLVGRLELADRSLAIAAVHLTSNHKPDALDKRREQFEVLAQWLTREAGDAIVLGDFNFGDGEENARVAAAGLLDAWQVVHPHHPGFTFDPVANPLAAINSHSGQAGRYDRVLMHSPGQTLAPVEVTMFGERAFAEDAGQGLFTSDHFGLCCLLQVTGADDPVRASLAAAAPVHRSALVVLPPAHAGIEAIRAAHDPSHARWMPAQVEAGVAALPPWSVLPSPRHTQAVQAVARACVTVLGADDAAVHVVGSARLGVASADSDLDLVCAGPDRQDRGALFAAVQDRLAQDGLLTSGREVAGAGLSLLRCQIGDVAVDLQFAGLPPSLRGRGLAGLDVAALATLDDASRRAALGCVDADALMRLVMERVDVAVFVPMLRQVRAWARARQLDVGAWGLLGGYTWALLAGFAARGAAPDVRDPDALLRHFFALFAAWEPGRPVAFAATPAAAPSRRAPWPIYTPTPSSFNSARSLTRSTHELLRAEIARGAALLAAGEPLAALCTAVDPPTRRITLALRADDPAALATGAGWLDGQVLGLLLALEREGARVRPYPRPVQVAGGLDYSIGVEGGGGALITAARAFAAEFEGWIARPGASLTATLVQR